MPIPSVLEAAHELVACEMKSGGIAIDATVGNGHDTLFLVQEVGAGGQVIGFDVQTEALVATRKRVSQEAPAAVDRLRLVHDGHQRMTAHLGEEMKGKLGVIMFNLGYLPGSDHSITTEPKSTLDALREGVTLLRPGGLITVVAYPGHEGGATETEAVSDWSSALPQDSFRVLSYRFVNQRNDPPRLFAVEKRLKSE